MEIVYHHPTKHERAISLSILLLSCILFPIYKYYYKSPVLIDVLRIFEYWSDFRLGLARTLSYFFENKK
jgi:hypothetical protein